MIEIMVPDTPDETLAKQENELLSRNQLVKIDINQDHLSHMVIHAQADDSPAKFAHIEAHRQAYMLQRGNMPPMMSEEQNKTLDMQAAMSQSQIGNQLSNLSNQGQPAYM
jgi:REP element-mobilizing transposase RayT